MNAELILDTLAVAGIRLVRNGTNIDADFAEETDLTPHLETIRAHKTALLAALDLRERIIAAATVDPAQFDRAAYDALWMQWGILNTQHEDAA